MKIQRIAAFSHGPIGGNPAGVAIYDAMPEPEVMQALAAEIGYSETAFAAPAQDAWRVRYFAPEVEVDFCGHATIALAAALARRFGPGQFTLQLNRARIAVEGRASPTDWGASFVSPPTWSAPVAAGVLAEALALFGLTPADLDPRIPPAVAHGGGDHLVLALRSRGTLRAMRYNLDSGRAMAEREGFVTLALIHAEEPRLFHARNAFPIGGVREDPATGAAAAALGGYLRDLGWRHEGGVVIHQGQDMGVPCLIETSIPAEKGAGVRVSGSVREIEPA
jgi:PhzF family phenazine biosynthesis protein